MTKPKPLQPTERDAHSAAIDLLTNPHSILARALQLAIEADGIHGELADLGQPSFSPDSDTAGISFEDHVDRVAYLTRQQQSALDVAAQLARIAEVTIAVRADERAARPEVMLDLGDEEGAEDAQQAAYYEALFDPKAWPPPQPLQTRFTARIEAEAQIIGGWFFADVPGVGWVSLDEFEEFEPPEPGQPYVHELRGRALSRSGGQVLCQPDGGRVLALPEALLTLEPDE